MAKNMTLPKIGVNMTEATITKWLISVGDTIAEGDVVCEAETDKSTQEIYATESGIVGQLLVAEGETVLCHQDMLMLLAEGEEAAPLVKPTPTAPAAPAAPKQAPMAAPSQLNTAIAAIVKKSAPTAATNQLNTAVAAIVKKTSKVRISPLAKKIAKEMGIDISLLSPAAPGARIVKKDVLSFKKPSVSTTVYTQNEVQPMSSVRKVIAKRMSESYFEKPTVPLTAGVDATALLALRSKYKERGFKIPMDAIIAKTVAVALQKHKIINSRLNGDNIEISGDINVSVAVDTDRGLTVPVIRNTNHKSIVAIGEELTELAQKAKENRLTPDEMAGSTFTITNLGMFGVDSFVPIINYPECCILSIGAINKTFVPDACDQPVLQSRFNITLVFDHRIVDGAPAARFLRDVVAMLECPELML